MLGHPVPGGYARRMPPAKRIPDPGFAGDDGSADPRLSTALLACAENPGRLPEVLAALHAARVLAPVVAVLGESGTTEAGLRVDKTSDIALPVLVSGDGERAVPVFTDLAAMARWEPTARPVPVEGVRAAAVALAEGAAALVLDLAGPASVTLGEPELRALVEGRGTVPAYVDPALSGAVAARLAGDEAVRAAWLEPWPGVDARLTFAVADAADAAAVGARLADALRDLVGTAVRGLEVAVTADPGAAPRGGATVLRSSPG